MRDELSAESYPSANPPSADPMRSMLSAVSMRDIVSNVMFEFPLSRLEAYQPLPSSCNLFLKKVQDSILFLAIPKNNVYFCVKSMVYWTYGTW